MSSTQYTIFPTILKCNALKLLVVVVLISVCMLRESSAHGLRPLRLIQPLKVLRLTRSVCKEHADCSPKDHKFCINGTCVDCETIRSVTAECIKAIKDREEKIALITSLVLLSITGGTIIILVIVCLICFCCRGCPIERHWQRHLQEEKIMDKAIANAAINRDKVKK